MKNISFILLFLFFSVAAWAETGVVRKAIGEVFVDGKKINEGMKVTEGQTLEAKGPKSLVIIKLESGGQIALKDGAMKMEIAEKKNESVINLTRGVFASHFIKGKTTQKIRTKYAVMGVRGTKYYIEEKNDSSYLCVCEGAVEISSGRQKELIGVNEDALAKTGEAIKKSKANQMMIDMARDFVGELEK